jgi:hypothetical protein
MVLTTAMAAILHRRPRPRHDARSVILLDDNIVASGPPAGTATGVFQAVDLHKGIGAGPIYDDEAVQARIALRTWRRFVTIGTPPPHRE